jgi:hypothetical protein
MNAVIIKIDAKAWVRKYFKAAEVLLNLTLLIKIGTNTIKFTSSASHAVSQELQDRAIMVLTTNVIINI